MHLTPADVQGIDQQPGKFRFQTAADVVQVGAVLIVFASVWPVVTLFNRVEPFIAGQPLFVVYSVSFAFTVAVFLAFMYRLSRTEPEILRSEAE